MAILDPSFLPLFRIGPWNTPAFVDGSTFPRRTGGEPGLLYDHFSMVSNRRSSPGTGDNPLWRTSAKDGDNDPSNFLELITISIPSEGSNKHPFIMGGKRVAEIEVDRTGGVSLRVLAQDVAFTTAGDDSHPLPKGAVIHLESDVIFYFGDIPYAVSRSSQKVVIKMDDPVRIAMNYLEEDLDEEVKKVMPRLLPRALQHARSKKGSG